MHTARKSSDIKSKTKEKSKDDIPPKKENEKLKKSVYSVSTPRPYLQPSTTADIYSRQNSALKAPKKSTQPTSKNTVSPMKNLLKASPSLTQIKKTGVKKTEPVNTKAKAVPDTTRSNKTPRSSKNLPFTNVTVNSPAVKRKLVSEFETKLEDPKNNRESRHKVLEDTKVSSNKVKVVAKDVESKERQRTKTRTLDEGEVKILTPDAVDNNAEMLNLAQKLKAQPKAFFVDLNGEQSQAQKDKQSSEEDISYEDDFESYESDFDSYHSSSSSKVDNDASSEVSDTKDHVEDDGNTKEEKMLDSGTFELRDRSATKTKPMEFILEDTNDKKVSLTDEGFQEMSSSSAVSSMKTVHVEVLERPLFIDFTKSKENRKKRRIFEKLKQRAKDILSMVTLHEMSFTLFEMKPIPYDLYMATFGKANYTQVSVQTFDDGISQEVQTEDIELNNKWTQHPVEFTNEIVCVTPKENKEKVHKGNDDVLTKVTDLINFDNKSRNTGIDDSYRTNHLRAYLEQKHGAGSDETLPLEIYESKIKKTDFSVINLRKFLKKVEGRLSNILSTNTGNTQMSNLISTSKFPFSKDYVSISMKNYKNNSDFMTNTKIIGIVFSETKSNLIFTIHVKSKTDTHKSVLCLWDLSIAMLEPIKLLIATDNIEKGKFRGSTDGIFVAALKDGTVHLWDLAEETNCFDSGIQDKEAGVSENKHSQSNRTNHSVPKRSCAYTSSASNMNLMQPIDRIVGLEFTTSNTVEMENGNKVIGQVFSLQKRGILTLYSIVQEKQKNNTYDIGKAFWSKMRLEKYQYIDLVEHYVPINNLTDNITDFNLNIAKKRLTNKRNDKTLTANISRPKSSLRRVDSDRPKSAARFKSVIAKDSNWECGIVCSALKIINLNNIDNYLIAKNCGEVLNCKRTAGIFKVFRFNVTNDASVITFLEASPNGLPYFLAATDSGTIHLCSLLTSRVLLTLDSRKTPSILPEKYNVDSKGRFVGTVAKSEVVNSALETNLSVTSLAWSQTDPFYITSLMANGRMDVWMLTHSDIHPYRVYERAAVVCAAKDRNLALLNTEGDVDIYRINTNKDESSNLEVFKKYVSLL
ncbi:uncharacterized protein LOC123702554 [Colias croceus]|uniref:uncharacterized protein LOC123702554 n=1 Tax=Colias crocea TaxID=72248 RepID=UPI001E27CE4C|nr:uncharacterized protein LOC123702554 [Colias croceus]